MGNIVLSIALCVLLPFLLLSVYLDKRGRRMMLAMAAGIVACLLAYFINKTLKAALSADSGYYSSTFAPLVEEVLKSIPILVLSAIFRRGRRGSASLAFAVGAGFCVVENFFYLVSGVEELQLVWVISRAVGTGLMHCMSSTVLGLGIFYGRKEKRMRLQCISASLALSVIYHGLYNLLVQSESLQLVGLALPLCTYLFLFVFLNRHELHKLLPEEGASSAGRK